MNDYSQDFKERLILEVHEVGSVLSVAKKHNIPKGTLYSWVSSKDCKSSKKIRVVDGDKDRHIKKLKKEIEDRDLKITLLKDLLKKSYHLWEIE